MYLLFCWKKDNLLGLNAAKAEFSCVTVSIEDPSVITLDKVSKMDSYISHLFKSKETSSR